MRRTTILILTVLTCVQTVHGESGNEPTSLENSDDVLNETLAFEQDSTEPTWNMTEMSMAMTSVPIAAQVLYEQLASRPNATTEEVVSGIRQFVSEIWKTIEKLIGDSDGSICVTGTSGFPIDLPLKPNQIVSQVQWHLSQSNGINIPVVPHLDENNDGALSFQTLSINSGTCGTGGDGPASVEYTDGAKAGVQFEARLHPSITISIGDAKEWSEWAAGR